MTALTIFDMICPTYKDDSDKANFILLATSQTSATAFGVNLPWAIALRAAHMITLAKSTLRTNGEAGPVASKSEGDLSVSFGSGGSDNGLNQTHFGKQLLDLIRDNIIPIAVTGGNDNGSPDNPYPS